MLIKGIIHLLIWVLFVSRIIPKYLIFRETNQVQLFGFTWEGSVASLILLGAAAVAIAVLAIGIKYIYQYFTESRGNSDN